MAEFCKKLKVWEGNGYTHPKFDMDIQELLFVNKSPNADPSYAKDGDSGFDVRAWITKDDENARVNESGGYEITLKSLERQLIHTGLYFDLPKNTEIQVRTRSGMANRLALCVANSPGTVDEFYTGEVCVIAINLSRKPFKITNGDRIAQCVLAPVYNKELVNLKRVDVIDKQTSRGDKGFGSTGIS